MDDTHPLKHMVGVDHITPLLGYLPFFKKKNISFRHCVRLSLCAELGVKIPESDLQLRDKPFLMAGYGVNAYYEIL